MSKAKEPTTADVQPEDGVQDRFVDDTADFFEMEDGEGEPVDETSTEEE